MKVSRSWPGALVLVLLAGTMAIAGTDQTSASVALPATGCPMFPADSYWHAKITSLPVLPNSAALVKTIGETGALKADFGSGRWNDSPIGIPYVVVPANQPRVRVVFDNAGESDAGPYPVPATPPIEGGAHADGDRHLLIVDEGACKLYELYHVHQVPSGAWTAGSGAIWDLKSNALRPADWTSADAAGLPILPGLVRYGETAAGHIDHPIRITVPVSRTSYLWPARHQAGSTSNVNAPAMGQWFRLKASVKEADFPASVRPIIVALKTYGAVVADNGSPWYMSGVPDPRWNNDDLQALRAIKGSDFDAVDASALMIDRNSGRTR